jgi:hypothetical protein
MRSSNRSMTVDGFSRGIAPMPFTRRVHEVVIEGTAVERRREEALNWRDFKDGPRSSPLVLRRLMFRFRTYRRRSLCFRNCACH